MHIEQAPIHGVHNIRARRDGPHVTIFGGTHGDEVSGVEAVRKMLDAFAHDALTLQKGLVTIAVANEEAVAKKKRYLTYNLNRCYKETSDSDIDIASYEYQRAQTLKPFLEASDYFLDLHSAPIAQEPFLICEAEPATLYRKLGIPKIITGWNNFSEGTTGGDGENYANAHGALAATLEAGNHFDPHSIEVAYAACLSLLSLLDLIEPSVKTASVETKIFDLYLVQTKDSQDFRYIPDVKNFQFIPNGTPYAFQHDRPLIATEDSYLLVPMKPEETNIGEEICYLGRKKRLILPHHSDRSNQ